VLNGAAGVFLTVHPLGISGGYRHAETEGKVAVVSKLVGLLVKVESRRVVGL
jgi:hypothetical protein